MMIKGVYLFYGDVFFSSNDSEFPEYPMAKNRTLFSQELVSLLKKDNVDSTEIHEFFPQKTHKKAAFF